MTTTRARLGAVGYLNARPLVVGLDRSPRFDLRFDLPSECARLLAAGEIDLGLIPSIEYVRERSYRMVPGLAITSTGPVASVALFTTRPMHDVRSIAMDTSSRTSVALTRVLCARLFKIAPAIEARPPELASMLAHADAALLIGDNALLVDPQALRDEHGERIAGAARLAQGTVLSEAGRLVSPARGFGKAGAPDAPYDRGIVEKIDLGEAWTSMSGLPFVWAFWAGRPGAVGNEDVAALQASRDAGVKQLATVAREYFRDQPEHHELGARYLRDNIKYDFGEAEAAGLAEFYRYASEIGIAPGHHALRFY